MKHKSQSELFNQMEPFLGQITREVDRNRIQQVIQDKPNAEITTAERLHSMR